jgi:hypothetical protein
VVALAVAVLEGAAQHPRHDLHVAVGVRAEPGGGRDPVVVVDEQEARGPLCVGRPVLAEVDECFESSHPMFV